MINAFKKTPMEEGFKFNLISLLTNDNTLRGIHGYRQACRLNSILLNRGERV